MTQTSNDQYMQMPNVPFIDPTTGEDMRTQSQQTKALEPLAAMVDSMVTNGRMPIHIEMMQKFDKSSDEFSSYVGVPWIDVKKRLNQAVKVIGAIVWFSGAYSPQKPAYEGEVREGYYKVLLKTSELEVIKNVPIDRKLYDIKYNVIVQTSSKKVAELVLGLIAKHGWYDWPAGTYETILFGGDSESGFTARTIGDLTKFAQSVSKE